MAKVRKPKNKGQQKEPRFKYSDVEFRLFPDLVNAIKEHYGRVPYGELPYIESIKNAAQVVTETAKVGFMVRRTETGLILSHPVGISKQRCCHFVFPEEFLKEWDFVEFQVKHARSYRSGVEIMVVTVTPICDPRDLEGDELNDAVKAITEEANAEMAELRLHYGDGPNSIIHMDDGSVNGYVKEGEVYSVDFTK
jgi:hypothetical protein